MSPQQPANEIRTATKATTAKQPLGKAALTIADIYIGYLDEVTCIAAHCFSNYPDCEERAENTAQEVFIKLLSQHDISRIRNIEAWLFKVTKHTCLRTIAREKTIKPGEIRAWYQKHNNADWLNTARNEREKQDRIIAEIEAELQQLDLLKRRIIYCKYYLKMTINEIAIRVSISPGRVRSQLQYAITKLRSKFNHHK